MSDPKKDKYKGEEVLVFSREIHGDDFWKLSGVFPVVGSYLDLIFENGKCQFMNRVQAEVDPRFKQIIPYVVYVCGGHVFSYVRGKTSGEKRLVGNRSIAIGGHINPIDNINEATWAGIFLRGARREVREELKFKVDYALVPDAIINDASSEVGKVHFGVLFIVYIENESDISVREDCLTNGEFISIAKLKGVLREELENWSKLVIDYL
jgi:predicted NUDIX family phosphoesterase